MTPLQFQRALDILRLSFRGLAPLLGCSSRLPREWAAGEQSVPPAVAEWLERCVAIRREHPFPAPPSQSRWRRREVPRPAKKRRARKGA